MSPAAALQVSPPPVQLCAPALPVEFPGDVAERGEHACTLALRHAGRRPVLVRWELCGPADAPLLVIPLDLPQPRTLGGLYVPARYAPGQQAGGVVDLFQARMGIRLNDPELLPEWAPFVRGIVDCVEVQPTAARDNVQRDSVYHALRDALDPRKAER